MGDVGWGMWDDGGVGWGCGMMGWLAGSVYKFELLSSLNCIFCLFDCLFL